jgi:hypothetical protein
VSPGLSRSRIAVNADVPMSAVELLRLTSHETYPGHHAERAAKDPLLVHGRRVLEETLVLVPTPQSLVSEGIAELAPTVLLAGDGGPAIAAVVHDAGIELVWLTLSPSSGPSSRAAGRRSTPH